MATTTASPKRGKAKVTPADILAVANDVSTHVLIERANEMRVIVRGALAGVNVHQLGPPGSGKSLGLREFARRITGASFFEKAVHAQMPADAIVGGYDMPRFAKTGEFARNVDHYLPNAHIGFVDEVTRANGPTLDALLPLFNTEERSYEANGGMNRSPLEFLVTASNFMPEPDDARLGALVDRFTLMQYIDYVKAEESFMEMLERHHARRLREAGEDTEYEPATITLDQFQIARAQVGRVALSPEFKAEYAKLRAKAKAEGLFISDRRWMELSRVARATAWLGGRDALIPEDIAAVEDGLWRTRDEIPISHMLVLDYHGRFVREAQQKRQEAEEPLAEWERIRPLVEGTPPNQSLDSTVLRDAINCSRKLGDVLSRIDVVLAEAKKEKRDAAELRDLGNELRAVMEWFKANKLPHTLDD